MSQERSLKYLLVYIDIGNSWISPNNTYLYFNQLSLKYFWSFTELHVRCSGHTFRRNDRSRKDKGVEDEPIKHYTDIHVNHDRAWKGLFSRNLYKSVEGYNRWKFYYLHKKYKAAEQVLCIICVLYVSHIIQYSQNVILIMASWKHIELSVRKWSIS